MRENFGKGWSGPKEAPQDPSLRHKPYGLKGLPRMNNRENRYIKINRAPGGVLHSHQETHNPNNSPRKPFAW